LSEVLSERESISEEIQRALDTATDPWGICVERVELKDCVLPAQVRTNPHGPWAMVFSLKLAKRSEAKIAKRTVVPKSLKFSFFLTTIYLLLFNQEG
jgi:regulator of protease activity HflC (stomatin/prohibitin superfamily)